MNFVAEVIIKPLLRKKIVNTNIHFFKYSVRIQKKTYEY